MMKFEMLRKIDPIKLTAKIPNEKLRKRALDVLMTASIPFNRWLGFRFETVSPGRVVVLSPPRKLRENHVGGAHACFLALMSEYPAGICVASHYGIEDYRLIISKLEIEYAKQGRGWLRAEALAPRSWPEPVDGEAWIEMTTKVTDSQDALVATCRTKWQLKEWSRVGRKHGQKL